MDVHLKVAAGLGSELISRLYGSYARRIREIVSNALDAGADEIFMDFDLACAGGKITFRDNGSGMTEDVIREEFLNVGASRKRSDPSKIGRIGIGFLAMAGLGQHIKIYTRSQTGESIQDLTLTLDTKRLLDETLRGDNIQAIDVGSLVPNVPSNLPQGPFTLIEITNLTPGFYTYLSSEENDLIFQLRRILPLSYPDSSPLFSHLSEIENGQELIFSLRHLRTITFYYKNKPLNRLTYYEEGIMPKISKGHTPPGIWKIYFLDSQVKDSGGNPVRLFGYLCLTSTNPTEPWRGFVTRVKNIAVQESGWLNLSSGQVTAMARLSGELFIDGIDDNYALNMDRTSFNYEYPQMVVIIEELSKLVTPIRTSVQKDIKTLKPKDTTVDEQSCDNSGEENSGNGDAEGALDADKDDETNPDHAEESQDPEAADEGSHSGDDPGATPEVETSNQLLTASTLEYKKVKWKIVLQDFDDVSNLGDVVRNELSIYLNAGHHLISGASTDIYKIAALLLLLKSPNLQAPANCQGGELLCDAVDVVMKAISDGVGA